MGRQAAGEAFLRAYQNHYGYDEIDVLLHTPQEAHQSHKHLSESQGFKNVNVFNLWEFNKFTNKHLYLPSPGIGEIAVQRAKNDERSFSLSGITHTTATHRVMQTISELLTDPIRPWDALICTSTSVRESVEIILQERKEYLQWKLGATRFELPQLPIIPLGVHCEDFIDLPNTHRVELGIAKDDIVIVYVGRLSFHAKAHPHPMFKAIEDAASKRVNQQQKIHLIQCGWFANEHIENAFIESENYLSPNVIHHHLDGRVKDNIKRVWSVADIFMSLSDNIQETFGLTPIEAMACGIPSVVSDWNGYKDTIIHNETGFRIKTTMPSRVSGVGAELADNYATGADNYDMYCGHSCENISVDIPETAYYLGLLINDPNLRQKIGKAAQQRARTTYDWAVIMQQYEYLWQQQEYTRKTHKDSFSALPQKVYSGQLDPYYVFQHYPTVQLNEESQFVLNERITSEKFSELIDLKSHSFSKSYLPDITEFNAVLDVFTASSEPRLHEFLSALKLNRKRVEITLSWLMKVGVVSLK